MLKVKERIPRNVGGQLAIRFIEAGDVCPMEGIDDLGGSLLCGRPRFLERGDSLCRPWCVVDSTHRR
jgi:hypothetical protein